MHYNVYIMKYDNVFNIILIFISEYIHKYIQFKYIYNNM